jgi:arylsulfatase A-like enzyme
MRGRSVRPLLTDPAARAAWPDDVFVQISESQVGRAVRTARWKYGVYAPGVSPTVQPAADRYREQYLYDLLADRYELYNLAGSRAHAEVSDRLRQRLLRHLRAVEGAEPTIEPAGARSAGGIRVGEEELAGL